MSNQGDIFPLARAHFDDARHIYCPKNVSAVLMIQRGVDRFHFALVAGCGDPVRYEVGGQVVMDMLAGLLQLAEQDVKRTWIDTVAGIVTRQARLSVDNMEEDHEDACESALALSTWVISGREAASIHGHVMYLTKFAAKIHMGLKAEKPSSKA